MEVFLIRSTKGPHRSQEALVYQAPHKPRFLWWKNKDLLKRSLQPLPVKTSEASNRLKKKNWKETKILGRKCVEMTKWSISVLTLPSEGVNLTAASCGGEGRPRPRRPPLSPTSGGDAPFGPCFIILALSRLN